MLQASCHCAPAAISEEESYPPVSLLCRDNFSAVRPRAHWVEFLRRIDRVLRVRLQLGSPVALPYVWSGPKHLRCAV